jgi:hypothetical protein
MTPLKIGLLRRRQQACARRYRAEVKPGSL